MRLDHVSYAAGPEGLAACVQRLGSTLGASFLDGGLHPRFGTRNFVLPLRGRTYLEVVDVLDHPAVDTAPFGRAVRDRRDAGGGWLGWAVRVDDMAPIEQRLRRHAVEGHRRRPDGFDLRWAQLGVLDLAIDPQRPFFVRWLVDDEHHPSAGGELPGTTGVTLTHLEIAGDDEAVELYLGASTGQPLDGITVEWLTPQPDTGIVAATFDTGHGPVRID
ncbi:MAG: VOC family protein [Actinobacteria bacterium]|nr:VOC family protein [Actinomycetota bacterium]